MVRDSKWLMAIDFQSQIFASYFVASLKAKFNDSMLEILVEGNECDKSNLNSGNLVKFWKDS